MGNEFCQKIVKVVNGSTWHSTATCTLTMLWQKFIINNTTDARKTDFNLLKSSHQFICVCNLWCVVPENNYSQTLGRVWIYFLGMDIIFWDCTMLKQTPNLLNVTLFSLDLSSQVQNLLIRETKCYAHLNEIQNIIL